MRLVDTTSLKLVTKNNADVPPYAILSHTWGDDTDEITLHELEQLSSGFGLGRLTNSIAPNAITKKPGYAKLQASAAKALSHGHRYIWIDTCCIDKTSSAELSEAINSMFRWYRDAEVCYVLLDDVEVLPVDGKEQRGTDGRAEWNIRSPGAGMISTSRWFTRGWTLQELIAPSNVEFYSRTWTLLGAKMNMSGPRTGFPSFISQITGIHLDVLLGYIPLEQVSVAERMHWASRRQTTRVEDAAYCLMGIFGVHMPLLYGEGEQAFIRLQVEILRSTTDQSIFAWQCSQEDVLRYQLCGLLAPNPAYFRKSGGVGRPPSLLGTSQDSAPSTMTNAGLHVRLKLGHVVKDGDQTQYTALLDCIDRPGPEKLLVPSITLVSLGGDQYARASADYVFNIPLDQADKDFEHKYVYVRQFSVQVAPAIRFLIDVPDSSILEVHPSRGWDKSLGIIRPDKPNHDGILAAVRYHAAPDMVDVFVGISSDNLSQLKAQFWCHQTRSTGPDLAHAMRRFDKSRMLQGVYDGELSKRGFCLGRVASLREEQSHGKSYLTLLVENLPELHGTQLPGIVVKVPDPLLYSELGGKSDKPSGDDWTLGLSRLFRRHIDIARDPEEDPKAYSTGFLIRIASRPLLPQLSGVPPPVEIEWMITNNGTIRKPGFSEASSLETYFSRLLITACIKNDDKGATELLESVLSCAMVEAVTSFDETGERLWFHSFQNFRPLHWATLFGKTDIVRVLLRHNALVMSTTASGWTSIHIAAMQGDLEVLSLLVKAARDDDRVTLLPSQPPFFEHPCHLAATYVRSETVRDIFSLLMPLPTPDDHTNVQRQTPTSLNQITNGLGETPLHRAAAVNNLYAAEAIVTMDDEIDVNLCDAVGRTPIWHAAAAGSQHVANYLINHGADLTLPDKNGLTPLHVACRGGHNSTIELLLVRGAELSPHPDTVALTPAHFAALGGNADSLAILKRHGQDLDRFIQRGGKGISPLHVALVNFNSSSFRYLEWAGCDVTREGSYHVLLDSTKLSGIEVTGRAVRLRRMAAATNSMGRGPVNALEYMFEHGEVTLAGNHRL